MTEGTALVEMHVPHDLAEGSGSPPALFLKEARAAERFWDFFTANIRNKNTRLLQRCLQVLGILRGAGCSRSGGCEAGACLFIAKCHRRSSILSLTSGEPGADTYFNVRLGQGPHRQSRPTEQWHAPQPNTTCLKSSGCATRELPLRARLRRNRL